MRPETALMLVCGAAGAAAALPRNVTALATFYGAKDNCPPGGAIAYPVIHQQAGGTGTFADPITFAGARAAVKPGTRVYAFWLQKYFIMEDDCEECDGDWSRDKAWHFDLWTGPDNVTPGPNLISCEDALTESATLFEVDALPSYPVNVTPLFNNATLACIVPISGSCTDVGNECGNSCEIPVKDTCPHIAAELLLNYTRFLELNPGLNCSGIVPEGTSVCMGGTCGD